jgi:16S rRNA processing protein RimM
MRCGTQCCSAHGLKSFMAKPQRIILAVIGAPHGVKGEVRVKCFGADPLALGEYGPLTTTDGRTLSVDALRPLKGDLVVARFREIADRSAAERLNGAELTVLRSALPAEDDADTFYHADLIGLRAETADGAELGTVAAIYDFGAGDVIELRGEAGTRVLPFTKAVVPVVDVAGGRVVVALPDEIEGEPSASQQD